MKKRKIIEEYIKLAVTLTVSDTESIEKVQEATSVPTVNGELKKLKRTANKRLLRIIKLKKSLASHKQKARNLKSTMHEYLRIENEKKEQIIHLEEQSLTLKHEMTPHLTKCTKNNITPEEEIHDHLIDAAVCIE